MIFLNSSDTFNFGISQPHLALVMENGSVWDIKSNDQFKTIRKNLLIQLPKSTDYHTFSTRNGVLNFVKDDLSSNIIQYGKSLKPPNHIRVKKSSVQFKYKIDDWMMDGNYWDGLRFGHGIQVGSMFWLVSAGFGISMSEKPLDPDHVIKSSTMLWFSNKQRWRQGPDLHLRPQQSFINFCSSSLNSTAIMFVFIGYNYVTKVSIFNFQFNVWTDIPNMKEILQEFYMTCTMATLFSKQTRPRVVVIFNGMNLVQFLKMNII